MTRLIFAGQRIVILLVLQTLYVGVSHSKNTGSPIFIEEVSKREDIYQSRGVEVPEGCVIDRSLLSYTFTLPYYLRRSDLQIQT
jgi:hypothetical protein